jgi:DNA-binding beta-propeller fold protein YncE
MLNGGKGRGIALGAFLLSFGLSSASAQIVVSANDNKVMLVNGVNTVVANPPPDTVTIIDLGQSPPKVLGEVNAPASVVGPPSSVAITPDERLALVTAAMKIDPADPKKTIADSTVSVIDLKAQPPRVIATLEAGKSAAGLSINRQGTLALVANREEGTVSVFKIAGTTVTPAGKVTIADARSGVSHAHFTPDGKTALVTRDGDHFISVLAIDGDKVEYTKRDISAGIRPYGLDIAPDGSYAALANIGRGGGDSDTVSLIDLRAKPPRVVDTVSVGQTPEGLTISPDGKSIAVVVMNGSYKPKESPFFNDNGLLVLLAVDGLRLRRVSEARIGHWSQAAAFSRDGKTLLVSNMVEQDIQVLSLDGQTLKDAGQRIKVNGGPAALRTANK